MVEPPCRLSFIRVSHPRVDISWAAHFREICGTDKTHNDAETEETSQGSARIRNYGRQIEKGERIDFCIGYQFLNYYRWVVVYQIILSTHLSTLVLLHFVLMCDLTCRLDHLHLRIYNHCGYQILKD